LLRRVTVTIRNGKWVTAVKETWQLHACEQLAYLLNGTTVADIFIVLAERKCNVPLIRLHKKREKCNKQTANLIVERMNVMML